VIIAEKNILSTGNRFISVNVFSVFMRRFTLVVYLSVFFYTNLFSQTGKLDVEVGIYGGPTNGVHLLHSQKEKE